MVERLPPYFLFQSSEHKDPNLTKKQEHLQFSLHTKTTYFPQVLSPLRMLPQMPFALEQWPFLTVAIKICSVDSPVAVNTLLWDFTEGGFVSVSVKTLSMEHTVSVSATLNCISFLTL